MKISVRIQSKLFTYKLRSKLIISIKNNNNSKYRRGCKEEGTFALLICVNCQQFCKSQLFLKILETKQDVSNIPDPFIKEL